MNIDCFEAAGQRIMEDFIVFTDYLDNEQTKLSPKSHKLGKNDCFILNQRLKCVPELLEKPGRMQANYAEIDFFYYVCIRMGLYCVCRDGKNFVLRAQKRKLKFLQLSAADCYGLLLAAAVGEYLPVREKYRISQYFLAGFINNNKGLKVGEEIDKDENGWGDEAYYQAYLRIFQLFDIIWIKWAVNEDGRSYVDRLYAEECGIFIARNRLLKGQLDFWIDNGNNTDVCRYLNDFKSCLKSSPDMLMDFFKTEAVQYSGSYILKLNHGRCMRKLRIDGGDTLESLHNLIQSAVGFDDDHLYYFETGNDPYTEKYYCPDCNEHTRSTSEVTLNELGLVEGVIFHYLFDFGDEWLFELYVDKIIPERTLNGEIIEAKGKAPEQYPVYDEDWY